MPFYHSKKFKRLHAQWTKKLEQSGFEDIERTRHRGTVVQDLSERVHFRPAIAESNIAYYNWASEIIHTPRFRHGKFRAERYKRIWTRHAEGAKAAEIGRELGLSRWWVSDILERMREYFKEKRPAPVLPALVSQTDITGDITELRKENDELRRRLGFAKRGLSLIARGKMYLVISCRAVAGEALKKVRGQA